MQKRDKITLWEVIKWFYNCCYKSDFGEEGYTLAQSLTEKSGMEEVIVGAAGSFVTWGALSYSSQS